jgi:hypothetical protein
LDFALRIKDLEELHVNNDGSRDKPAIVETYINICNAYMFQNDFESAMDYAVGAISVSQRLLTAMMNKFS